MPKICHNSAVHLLLCLEIKVLVMYAFVEGPEHRLTPRGGLRRLMALDSEADILLQLNTYRKGRKMFMIEKSYRRVTWSILYN